MIQGKSFLELASERYSVRNYDSSRPVEDDKIRQILQAAYVAPTSKNKQPQKLMVIRSREAMERLTSVRPIFDAPAAILVAYDDLLSTKNERDGGHDRGDTDCAIVMTHMMLEASDLGLGSCWIAAFSPAEMEKAFDMPSSWHAFGILALGYPSAEAHPSHLHDEFRPWSEIVSEI